eukprot:1175878-Prorocentrum_minimum.AAC.1
MEKGVAARERTSSCGAGQTSPRASPWRAGGCRAAQIGGELIDDVRMENFVVSQRAWVLSQTFDTLTASCCLP